MNKINPNASTEVIIQIGTDDNRYSSSSPKVSNAELHCPSTWNNYITDNMVTSANSKGWSIYIGDTLKTV